jgi:hypothetical protein
LNNVIAEAAIDELAEPKALASDSNPDSPSGRLDDSQYAGTCSCLTRPLPGVADSADDEYGAVGEVDDLVSGAAEHKPSDVTAPA